MDLRNYVICLALLMAAGTSLWGESPDYPNDSASAEPIATDGSTVYGELTTADEDWFKFTPLAHSRYRVTMHNPAANYRHIAVYQADEFNQLIEIQNWRHWTSGSYRTLFVETDRTCYIRIYNETGAYSVSVEYLDSAPPDSYPNDCSGVQLITPDAPATVGTLDHTDPFDEDWFTFHTTALHMYRVTLTHADNSWARFRLFSADCVDQLYGDHWDITVISWYGEDYKLYVRGDAARLGNYYTIHVEDLGLYPDDCGNTHDAATAVATNGTQTHGEIDYMGTYHSDQDWFTFTPTAHTRYRLTLFNQDANYKHITLYQEDAFGDLALVREERVWDAGITTTVFIENTNTCYVRIDRAGGGYWFSVEQIDVTPPDAYSNSCAEATPLAPDTLTIGTLDHTDPFDEDWFLLPTQALHMYQIVLTHADNSWARHRLYSGDCVDQLYGDHYDITVTSWFGEDYRLYVRGDAARLGNYYTLEAIDLGLQADDHGNVHTQATPIPKDGTHVDGVVNYMSTIGRDEDWFSFLAGQDGSYNFTLYNPDANYKYIRVYRENEFGDAIEIHSARVWANTINFDLTLAAGTHYLRVDNAPGDYQVALVSPEPRCGDLDHPYPPGDANQDCYLDMSDVAMLAAGWLTCTDPNPPCNYTP